MMKKKGFTSGFFSDSGNDYILVVSASGHIMTMPFSNGFSAKPFKHLKTSYLDDEYKEQRKASRT